MPISRVRARRAERPNATLLCRRIVDDMTRKLPELAHVRASRILFVAGQDGREHAARFDVGGHQLEKLPVHRRTRGGAEQPLRPQRVHQVFAIHGRSPFSPAPTTSKALPSALGNGTDSSPSQCS